MEPVLAIIAVYVVVSIVCFAVYAVDKSAARSLRRPPRRRIPEQTLILLGLAGGWPGGVIAQQALRHKTRKRSFQLMFWVSVVANVAALVVVIVYVLPALR